MKTVALGTILRVSNPATVGFLAVGNLTAISVPGPEKPEIDVTDFDSTAAEFLAGLPDNGELSLSGFFNYADAGQAVLLEDAHDAEAPSRDFEIDFTRQDVQFTFSGWVKSFMPNAGGPNEAYTFEATLRVTGAVVITNPIP
jgi:hypothetical protein